MEYRFLCVNTIIHFFKKYTGQYSWVKPYDLIITDMWYPEKPGGRDTDSGEALIKEVKERGWGIPIILCSSVNYHFPGILGSVHYSENED